MNGVAIKDMNRDQLREAAKMLSVEGRSKMNASDLREAVRKAFQSAPLPLTTSQRMGNYARQNAGRKVTPAQARRLQKKAYNPRSSF